MNLESILKKNLSWNAARISLLANMIIALLKVRTVCLAEIATALSGKAKMNQNIKNCNYFLHYFPWIWIQ